MRVRSAAILALAAACLPACKKEEKREAGLAGGAGGSPVVVVEQPAEGGSMGPLDPEVEPNDARDQAGKLGLPGGVSGALARPDDVDFYRIEPGPARAAVIRLTGPEAGEGGGDLVLELFDQGGKPVARSDRGPAGTVEGLPNAALAAQAAYFVAVTQLARKGGKKKKAAPVGAETAAAPYQLTVDAVAPAAEDEVEPNDKVESAREVLLGEERSGYLGWGKDQDLWKVSLAGFTGGFGLDVAVDGVEGVALAVDILAADGRVLATRKGQKDRALLVRGLLPELGAPFYLARVSGSRSNPEQAYRLRPTSRPLADGDEAEPNDDPDRAIAAGPLGDGATGERRGFLDGGDTDVYKFDAGRETVGLTVSVEPPASTDVVLRVLGPGGSELASADNGKAGQREEIAGLLVGRGEIRFIAVTGTALGDEADPYVLRWIAAADLQAPSAPPSGTAEPDEPPVDDPYEQ